MYKRTTIFGWVLLIFISMFLLFLGTVQILIVNNVVGSDNTLFDIYHDVLGYHLINNVKITNYLGTNIAQNAIAGITFAIAISFIALASYHFYQISKKKTNIVNVYLKYYFILLMIASVVIGQAGLIIAAGALLITMLLLDSPNLDPDSLNVYSQLISDNRDKRERRRYEKSLAKKQEKTKRELAKNATNKIGEDNTIASQNLSNKESMQESAAQSETLMSNSDYPEDKIMASRSATVYKQDDMNNSQINPDVIEEVEQDTSEMQEFTTDDEHPSINNDKDLMINQSVRASETRSEEIIDDEVISTDQNVLSNADESLQAEVLDETAEDELNFELGTNNVAASENEYETNPDFENNNLNNGISLDSQISEQADNEQPEETVELSTNQNNDSHEYLYNEQINDLNNFEHYSNQIEESSTDNLDVENNDEDLVFNQSFSTSETSSEEVDEEVITSDQTVLSNADESLQDEVLDETIEDEFNFGFDANNISVSQNEYENVDLDNNNLNSEITLDSEIFEQSEDEQTDETVELSTNQNNESHEYLYNEQRNDLNNFEHFTNQIEENSADNLDFDNNEEQLVEPIDIAQDNFEDELLFNSSEQSSTSVQTEALEESSENIETQFDSTSELEQADNIEYSDNVELNEENIGDSTFDVPDYLSPVPDEVEHDDVQDINDHTIDLGDISMLYPEENDNNSFENQELASVGNNTESTEQTMTYNEEDNLSQTNDESTIDMESSSEHSDDNHENEFISAAQKSSYQTDKQYDDISEFEDDAIETIEEDEAKYFIDEHEVQQTGVNLNNIEDDIDEEAYDPYLVTKETIDGRTQDRLSKEWNELSKVIAEHKMQIEQEQATTPLYLLMKNIKQHNLQVARANEIAELLGYSQDKYFSPLSLNYEELNAKANVQPTNNDVGAKETAHDESNDIELISPILDNEISDYEDESLVSDLSENDSDADDFGNTVDANVDYNNEELNMSHEDNTEVMLEQSNENIENLQDNEPNLNISREIELDDNMTNDNISYEESDDFGLGIESEDMQNNYVSEYDSLSTPTYVNENDISQASDLSASSFEDDDIVGIDNYEYESQSVPNDFNQEETYQEHSFNPNYQFDTSEYINPMTEETETNDLSFQQFSDSYPEDLTARISNSYENEVTHQQNDIWTDEFAYNSSNVEDANRYQHSNNAHEESRLDNNANLSNYYNEYLERIQRLENIVLESSQKIVNSTSEINNDLYTINLRLDKLDHKASQLADAIEYMESGKLSFEKEYLYNPQMMIQTEDNYFAPGVPYYQAYTPSSTIYPNDKAKPYSYNPYVNYNYHLNLHNVAKYTKQSVPYYSGCHICQRMIKHK